MTTVKTLQEAPTQAEFRCEVQQKEKTLERHEVLSYDLKLCLNGMLRIASETLQGEFPISEQALPDVARIHKIPAPFFGRCDLRLRLVCINRCRHTEAMPNKLVQVVLRSGVIDRISNSNLLPASQLALVDTVSNASPKTSEFSGASVK